MLGLELVAGFAASAFADDRTPGTPVVQCAPDDPSSCAVPLKKGQAAPFTGQLLTTDGAIELGQKAEHCDEWTELAVSHTSSVARIKLDYEKAINGSFLRQMSKTENALTRDRDFWRDEAARKVEPPHWTSSPYFTVPVSVAATVFVIAVARWTIVD